MIIHLATAAGPFAGRSYKPQTSSGALRAMLVPPGLPPKVRNRPRPRRATMTAPMTAAARAIIPSMPVRDDYARDGKGDHSKHDSGWKGVKNDDCQPRKDYCQPQKDYCDPKPSDNCGKRDSYRNPGEALAEIDFSRW